MGTWVRAHPTVLSGFPSSPTHPGPFCLYLVHLPVTYTSVPEISPSRCSSYPPLPGLCNLSALIVKATDTPSISQGLQETVSAPSQGLRPAHSTSSSLLYPKVAFVSPKKQPSPLPLNFCSFLLPGDIPNMQSPISST